VIASHSEKTETGNAFVYAPLKKPRTDSYSNDVLTATVGNQLSGQQYRMREQCIADILKSSGELRWLGSPTKIYLFFTAKQKEKEAKHV